MMAKVPDLVPFSALQTNLSDPKIGIKLGNDIETRQDMTRGSAVGQRQVHNEQ